MAQATFPDGISTDVPDPVAEAVKEVIDAICKPMTDFLIGMEKLREYAEAGRRVNLEH